jgi:hypothetical protein
MNNMDIVQEVQEFLILAAEAESTNRAEGLADLKFVSGEQWPAELQNSRQLEARPYLTINKLDGFCRQVSNQQRQQRPRIKVHPTNSFATKKIADVISGICRHVEVNSNADTAYDTAFDLAVKIGWGYWRVKTDYCRDDSFDQDIFIEAVDNPFTVYRDPNSVLPDGSDMKRCIVTDVISRSAFRKLYPGKDSGSGFNQRGTGDTSIQWVTKEDIRIAEYYKIEEEPATLVMLSDKNVLWKDEYEKHKTIINGAGVEIVGERDSFKRKVKWYKVTAMEVLEEGEFPGRYIPIVPTYGNITVIDGKRKLSGMVRFGKDPQRMVNYWETAATEFIALAPKAKWLMAEGQDEGHENEWNRANISAMPVLRYKSTDIDGQPAQPPQRLQPEPPPVGILQALQVATGNLREVLGVNDPAQRIQGNVSGKALNAEKMQSDNSTFHYYDNLTRSIGHTGKIILGLIPHIYDKEREMRIIGDDGQPDMITINQQSTTAEDEVLNNVTIGEYDVVMDTGPGYNSKRIEAVEAMGPLMAQPEIMKVIGDLYFRNSDFPGSEVIADRLAAMNPLAKIDDKSPIPPQVQMKMKQDEQTIQQLQQQLQQAGIIIKTRSDIEKMKQDGETNREHMRSIVKAHDTEVWSKEERDQVQSVERTKLHDTIVRSQTQMDVEELKGHIALLLARIDERSAGKAASESAQEAI